WPRSILTAPRSRMFTCVHHRRLPAAAYTACAAFMRREAACGTASGCPHPLLRPDRYYGTSAFQKSEMHGHGPAGGDGRAGSAVCIPVNQRRAAAAVEIDGIMGAMIQQQAGEMNEGPGGSGSFG